MLRTRTYDFVKFEKLHEIFVCKRFLALDRQLLFDFFALILLNTGTDILSVFGMNTMADAGFLRGGTKLLFSPLVPKNCMRMKESGLRGICQSNGKLIYCNENTF